MRDQALAMFWQFYWQSTKSNGLMPYIVRDQTRVDSARILEGASVPGSTSTTTVPAATAARSLCSAWDVTLGGRDFCLVKVVPVTSYKWRDMGTL